MKVVAKCEGYYAFSTGLNSRLCSRLVTLTIKMVNCLEGIQTPILNQSKQIPQGLDSVEKLSQDPEEFSGIQQQALSYSAIIIPGPWHERGN